MPRLRTVSHQQAGWRRRRCGRGFLLLDEHGNRLAPADAERVASLAIPPAWEEVWICPDELGHLQAVGTDEAGRRQYLYHPLWRERRDVAKFERVVGVGDRLPLVRRRVIRALGRPGTTRSRMLALAVRLIDLGAFRLGAESYLDRHGSRGLTTLQCRHVSLTSSAATFRFVGKSEIEQQIALADARVVSALTDLTAHRRPGDPLLGWTGRGGSGVLSPDDINEHLHGLFEQDVTAKDLRTWQATVIAASSLAGTPPADSVAARRRQIRAAVVEVAEHLGNTPAVARSSYVHPKLLDLFDAGITIDPALAGPADSPRRQNRLDRAVVELLT